MRITKGEAMWLARRRLEMTAARVAHLLGVSEDRLREWERDRAPVDETNVRVGHTLECATQPLRPGELCALMRRRWRWTLDTLADVTGHSKVTLIQIEHDRWDATWLLRFWETQEWSEPARPASLTIGLPELPKGMKRPR